jgi:TonB family protein
MASASSFSKQASFDKGWPDVFVGFVYMAAAASVVLFGTLFFVIASAIHITVLLIFFGLIYVTFTLVYLSERIYLFINEFSAVCPYCHEKSFLPEYYCDNAKCGNIHRRLIPSSYGIFRHTCTCGQKLPATFFLNRSRLQARCGLCTKLLPPEILRSRKLFVAIMGGPSVGKSSYLSSAIWRLIEKKLPELGFSHNFIEAHNESDYENVRISMEKGRPPAKTVDTLPTAFNIMLTKGRWIKRLLYLYDPAGEAYAEVENLVLHKFHGYLSGCIFLVDPFSIPYVTQNYREELIGTEDSIKPGPLPLDDALSRVILSMEEHYRLNKTDRIKFPIAVVINKLDVFDLEAHIGDEAVSRFVKQSPTPVDLATARDETLRNQLQHWGQSGLVHRLHDRFSKVRYFACSSFGRLPQGRGGEFEPRGVIEPLMWILNESDRVIWKDAQTSASLREIVAYFLIRWRRAFAAIGVASFIIALAVLLWPSSLPAQTINVTLSSNQSVVQKGEIVSLSAHTTRGNGTFLNYDWQTTAGRFEGSGADVRLDTNSISSNGQSSLIEVSVTVTDTTGVRGSAHQSIIVQAPPPVQSPTPPVAESPPTTAQPQDLQPPASSSEPASNNEPSSAPVGALTVFANIDGVQVSVDGSSRGTFSRTPRTLRLSPGRHSVRASKAGYKIWEGAFNLNAAGREKVLISMDPLEPTSQERAAEQLRRAEQLFQQRQYDAAIEACDEGLRLDPGNQALRTKRSNIERAKQILNRPTSPSSGPFSNDERSRRPESYRQPVQPNLDDSNQRVEPASAVRRVTPVYPSIARSANVTGRVIVQVTIDESGNVISARALQGPAMLYQAAVDAAKQWKYKPARRGSQSVRDTQTINFNFTL